MRWPPFLILLYLMTALQVSHFLGIPHRTTWPLIEYLPILAVFYALYAAEGAGPICGLICGVMYDLSNGPEMIGTNAVPLALVAFLVVRIRLSIFREHFISQLFITLLAILTFGVLSIMMRVVVGGTLQGNSAWSHFVYVAGNGVYSCIVAPFLFWIFFRFQPLLGFSSHRARG